MKRRILLASLFVLIVCACNASTGTPTTDSPIAALDVQIEAPLAPVAAYVPQPAETAVTPKWNGPQVTTNEAHIRYILADIQLGNVADDYRTNSADEETAEALRRWDAGVRVTNSAEFERRIRRGRWYVVYTGTEEPVNGVDIDLSSDPN